MKKLVPDHIRNLVPYQSARRIKSYGNIWLNANESPFVNRIHNLYKNLNRYPECQPKELLKKYAQYAGINNKNILLTRGADEGIELLIRTFCTPKKDVIMLFPPTYDMYEVSAKIFGIKIIKINTLFNFQLDIHTIKKNMYGVKIIYICHPNNPTGNLIFRNDLITLLNFVQPSVLIVIDEAYIEFSVNDSFINELKVYPNLVILRTLSKAFGLAGIRCGFLLSNSYIIKLIQKVITPYPIAIPISDIAIKALCLKNIHDMKNNVKNILSSKLWLVEYLKNIFFIKKIFSSYTNFILIKCHSSVKIFQYLEKNGIIVRNQSHKVNLKNCLRISIGTQDECQQLVSVLSSYEEKNN